MNIQQYLDHMSSLSQHTRVKDKGQLSLGMLIEAIEGCEKDVNVVYDFGYMCPTSIDSWRGSYSELALNYESFKSEDKELTRDIYRIQGWRLYHDRRNADMGCQLWRILQHRCSRCA
jgi:hypothetical protein